VHVEPLGASAFPAPDATTRIIGNVYLVEATYLPSGEPAPLEVDARVVLVYPLLAGDHGGHEILLSRRGTRWAGVDTNDLRSIQQADGPIETLGYVAVGAGPPTSTSPTPGAADEGESPIATIAIVASLVVLAVGAAVALLPRRPSRPAGGGGTGSRRGSSRSGSRSTRRG
jgi:hypothetical protein